jgi:hypothetical protein
LAREFEGSVDLDAPRVSLVAHMRKYKAARAKTVSVVPMRRAQ